MGVRAHAKEIAMCNDIQILAAIVGIVASLLVIAVAVLALLRKQN